MKITSDEVFKKINKNSKKVKSFGVSKIGLFGSVIRNENVPGSDLDFLIEFEEVSFDNYMNLKFYLEDLFCCKVDLVMSKNLKTRIRPLILEEVVYAEGF